jgi:uncharacterized protein
MIDPASFDRHEAGLWEAASEGRLVMQRCRQCNRFQHYPRPICLKCRSTDLDFEEVSGRGTVHAHTTVFRSPDPTRFAPPYVVALIALDEGPVLMSNVVGLPVDQVRCGQRVMVEWRDLDDGIRIPVFGPMSEEKG